jgi:hypothetical protein
MNRVVVALLFAIALGGCKSKASTGGTGGTRPAGAGGGAGAPGQDPAADLAAETALLNEAQDAVGQLMKVAGNCEAVEPAFAAAYAKLDAAVKRVRTQAGKETLEGLQKQAATVKGACE